MHYFLNILSSFDDFFWSKIAFIIILVLGFWLSFKSQFIQITKITHFCKLFYNLSKTKITESKGKGVHPLKVFFASAGGNIGIGNVAGIVTAACIGGPGALLWVWIAGLLGSIVKYSEVYLGIKYRLIDPDGIYQGGPMYFLRKAFKTPIIPYIVAFLLCIYGIEIYQFSVIAESFAYCLNTPKLLVVFALLAIVLYTVRGGLERIGSICSWLMPTFMILYVGMGLTIVIKEINNFPYLIKIIFVSAFKGHAALGGFIGSSLTTTIHQGISRAAYSGDIGIGFDSVIQSQSAVNKPEDQAQLSIVGIMIDNIICTMSILIVLASGLWSSGLDSSTQVIEQSLAKYFPMTKIFVPTFFFVTGYTTITSYFLVGQKCAKFLAGKTGVALYKYYGYIALPLFCFLPQNTALLVMSISGALLLIFNLTGVFLLRKEIVFPKA